MDVQLAVMDLNASRAVRAMQHSRHLLLTLLVQVSHIILHFRILQRHAID